MISKKMTTKRLSHALCSIAVFVLFTNCNSTERPIVIQLNSLLHDDSSKAWMINSERINGVETTHQNQNFKYIIVFYNDLSYCEQTLNSLGNRPAKCGSFLVGHRNAKLTLFLDGIQRVFTIESYSKQAIELFVKEEHQTIYRQLIPFPKL